MLRNIYANNNITNVNYKLTRGGGCQKSYNIRIYKELKNKSIDKISSNR